MAKYDISKATREQLEEYILKSGVLIDRVTFGGELGTYQTKLKQACQLPPRSRSELLAEAADKVSQFVSHYMYLFDNLTGLEISNETVLDLKYQINLLISEHRSR